VINFGKTKFFGYYVREWIVLSDFPPASGGENRKVLE
jgi:hypothetical protein